MKAKINFSVGAISYAKGDIVPEAVALKYPHLVEGATEKEKKVFFEEKEKKEVPGISLKVTEKVKKKA
jgi:hypothetical protein